MLKNVTLKTALLVSLSVHLLFLSPWGALHFSQPADEDVQIEVTYILNELDKEEIEDALENIPENYDIEEKELEEIREAPIQEDVYIEKEKVEELEGYIAYYELIREKIKRQVAKYYTTRTRQGRVDVLFKLDKTGALTELSAEEGALGEIAFKSVRSASPFPPFPDALKKNELAFSVSVIFSKD